MTRIEQEQMVLKLAGVKGRIKRKDVMDLCRVSSWQAYYILRKLASNGELTAEGSGKSATYALHKEGILE